MSTSEMPNSETPTILIIVGITGDLSRRKLLPAIQKIAAAGVAPRKLKIIGVTRRGATVQDVLKGIRWPSENDTNGSSARSARQYLSRTIEMCQMDLANIKEYKILKNHIESVEKDFGSRAQRLYYLSIPPQISQPVVELLGKSGLAAEPDTKLLLEKPFGTDLASARELIAQTRHYFDESQIYRIDHFLAKEMAQNLVVFRDRNALFKRSWNNEFIESIEVMASEKIDIEGRTIFYEQTGALRDVVQSHLLQLAALTLMKLPPRGKIEDVPKLRLRALRQLATPPRQAVKRYTKRGQYAGYREEVGNPASQVETYASVQLVSKDPAWNGVPITLVTGKALKEKATQIRITYKKDEDFESNELVIKFQPDEGIRLALWTKIPGYDRQVAKKSLKLSFSEYFPELPEAYEQVLLDAINSNHSLFTGSEEVLESWRILEPVQKAWQMDSDDLVLYKPGTAARRV